MVIYIWKLKLAFLGNHWAILTKFCMQAFRYMESKIYLYNANHMTKMADIPIFGKNPLNYSTLEPKERLEEAWYVAPGTQAQ